VITLRRSEDRRHLKRGLSDTWMTFDPENPIDPLRQGFHALELLNEELLAPEMGSDPRHRDDLEIITYVHEGALVYQDDCGALGRLESGEFQRTNLRRGLRDRTLNGSPIDASHIFQGGIAARGMALEPTQEKRRFPIADREGVLRLVVGPDQRPTSLPIQSDVRLYSSILLLGHHLIHPLESGRGGWLHVITGRIRLGPFDLRVGDAAALENEAAISFTAQEPAEVLLFDLA